MSDNGGDARGATLQPVPIAGLVLDHVAVAVRAWVEAWPRFAGSLGGQWRVGGWRLGFCPALLEYEGGGQLELLAPNDEGDDFLRRFLARHGPGPHHLTFTVADLSFAVRELRADGFDPVGVDVDDPDWKEAFLPPPQASGIVVQLAQPSSSGDSTPPPPGFPALAAGATRARLHHVAHVVPGLRESLNLFAGVLGGRAVNEGEDEEAHWVELQWMGGNRVRLLQPASATSPLASWLGARPGRVHHLAFEHPDPAAVEDATAREDGTYEMTPDEASGTRLRIRQVWQ